MSKQHTQPFFDENISHIKKKDTKIRIKKVLTKQRQRVQFGLGWTEKLSGLLIKKKGILTGQRPARFQTKNPPTGVEAKIQSTQHGKVQKRRDPWSEGTHQTEHQEEGR